jgi:hypothetical protein
VVPDGVRRGLAQVVERCYCGDGHAAVSKSRLSEPPLWGQVVMEEETVPGRAKPGMACSSDSAKSKLDRARYHCPNTASTDGWILLVSEHESDNQAGI